MGAGNLNRFNTLAPYYDRLASFVFGGSVQKAQEHFISHVPHGSRVLVLGGGTGKLLDRLLHVPDVSVCFVEASSVMIRLAKQRVGVAGNVQFIHGTVDSVPTPANFEVIVAPFFLDLFSNATLDKELREISARCDKTNTTWIVTDFISNQRWHRVFLWVMYAFFRLTCRLSTAGLPAWENALFRHGLIEQQVAYFYNGFIKTALYHRNPDADYSL